VAKAVQFQELATFDLESVSGYDAAQADVATAVRFADAVEAAAQRIGRTPPGSDRSGSRTNSLFRNSGSWQPADFPGLLFDVEGETSVDVWRLLHTSRDIPPSLQDPKRLTPSS
jgi:toxin ParE1/3/4